VRKQFDWVNLQKHVTQLLQIQSLNIHFRNVRIFYFWPIVGDSDSLSFWIMSIYPKACQKENIRAIAKVPNLKKR